MLSPLAARNYTNFELFSERLAKIRFNNGTLKTTLIVCYAPTNDKPIEIKNKFYEDLQALSDTVQKEELKLIIGDFNAMVGNDTLTWSPTIGKHGLPKTNANGEHLLQF